MQLDLTAQYGRVNNILYQDGIQIVKFTFSNFCDWDLLSKDGVAYMERYINGYIDRDYFEFLPGYYQLYQSEVVNIEATTIYDFIEDVSIDSCDFAEMVIEEIQSNDTTELTIEVVGEYSHDPQSSRIDQVRFWINNGLSKASEIATKIDANPSYVQRLIKQVRDEG